MNKTEYYIAKEGSSAAKCLDGADAPLKSGVVVRNKITNNVVFGKTIKAGEKLDVPFSYSIEWPHSQKIEIN